MLRLSLLCVGLLALCQGIALPQAAGEGPLKALIPGTCPEFTTIKDFNVTAYLGRWYEIQKFSALFEHGKCIKADYSALAAPWIKVDNSGQDDDGTPFATIGNATTTDVSGQLVVYFPFPAPPGGYNVLHTDYDVFSAVYYCKEVISGLSIQYAWILARETTISAEVLASAKKVFEGFGIDTGHLVATTQDDTCTY